MSTPPNVSGEDRPGKPNEEDARPTVLTATELAILEVEKRRWKYAGAKEAAIRDLFGLSETRYYQVLNALLDRPEALAAEPLLVSRLRRLRAARHAQRSPRRSEG